MQKFGLQTRSRSAHSALEVEVVKEQATALGRAGRKLSLSLEHYQLSHGTNSHKDISITLENSYLLEISNNVWELMLQREFLGFTENNFQWVLSNYHIPQPALDRLGIPRK